MRSACGPSSFITRASSPSVVGHASGQCVKPKKTTTTLPLKSESERVLPVWSSSWKSRAKGAPVTSVSLNDSGFGAESHAPKKTAQKSARAASAFIVLEREIMVDQQCGKKQGQVEDRVAES